MLNILLAFIPITALLEWLKPDWHSAIFIASAMAIIPLAGWLSHATEQLAERTGEGIGGLLNATFGNAAELIIAIAAMRAGLFDVIKASIIGSIIGNIFLVLGAAMLAGGLKYHEQKYNAPAARSQATMLALAIFALIIPAIFQATFSDTAVEVHRKLSLIIAGILFVCYLLYLFFQLSTHKSMFGGTGESVPAESAEKSGSVLRSTLVLAASTALIAWLSEILVGNVEAAAKAFGMNTLFIGVIVVGIIGNAAEHTAAIVVARKNRLDLALSIAVGSGVQIALFVAPVLVFLSYFIGPQPFDLIFGTKLVLLIFMAILIIGQIASDGESNWLKGVQLLAIYYILGVALYFVPADLLQPK